MRLSSFLWTEGPRGRNLPTCCRSLIVTLADTVTKGERNLVAGGHEEDVLRIRRHFQSLMEPHAIVGRRVVGFISDNHIGPDLGVEVFILEPADDDRSPPVEADSDDPG